MPAYKIIYTRKDMPIPCQAIKYAHTEEQAIERLAKGSKTTGYRLTKTGVAITITDVKEEL